MALRRDARSLDIAYGFIEYAYAIRIKCLCLPARSTNLLQPLDVDLWSVCSRMLKGLDNAPRRGITGVDKGLFIQIFQEARKMFTNRLCRIALRSTGIYPHNPDAVLKSLPELNADENRIDTPASDESTSACSGDRSNSEDTTSKANARLVTSHNPS